MGRALFMATRRHAWAVGLLFPSTTAGVVLVVMEWRRQLALKATSVDSCGDEGGGGDVVGMVSMCSGNDGDVQVAASDGEGAA